MGIYLLGIFTATFGAMITRALRSTVVNAVKRLILRYVTPWLQYSDWRPSMTRSLPHGGPTTRRSDSSGILQMVPSRFPTRSWRRQTFK
ncbi:hypothetical protein PR003_g27383 [Phytophthora rubi]|uniref:Uncharacterized protein n=1 Tax=Phytophthora rubi TaxID=129364 RepID=A0A6A4C2Z3_9STRA|nr:hypothetical protein PR003_g27383 [Phytophthora rubi]